MSEWITKQQAKIMMWRLGAIMMILFAIDSSATAFVSVMIDTNWDELTGTQKWIRIALILKALATTMTAGLTTVIGKLQKDEFPIPIPGSQRTETTQVTQTQQTTETEKGER